MNTYRELKIWTLHIVYRDNLGMSLGGFDIVGFATKQQATKYAEENHKSEDWSVSCQTLEDFAKKEKSYYYEERERNNKLREEIEARAEKLAEEKFKQLIKNKSKEIAKVIERTLKS